MRFDNLVVYAQSTGNDKGRIDIEGADLLINVYNDFVINGGTVNLKSSVYANSLTVNGGDLIVSASDGISSGDITINGGSVDASAIDGSAIEAYGVMNVNGGAVTAYSENGYGISLMGEFIGDPFQLGTYYGSTTRQFTISQKPVNGFDLVYEENPTYTGSAVCPEITVKDGEKTLVQGTDYTVACNEIVNVGEKGYITVTGIGDYIGEVSGPVNLLPKSMDSQDISTTITWTYKNSMYVPTIAVKDGDRTLVENTDYSIETLNEDFYVTATINGIGNYVNSIGVAPVIVSGTQNDISVPDGALVVLLIKVIIYYLSR